VNEVGLGIIIMLALALLLGLTYAVGRSGNMTDIGKDCDALQTFRIDSVVYDCKKRAP